MLFNRRNEPEELMEDESSPLIPVENRLEVGYATDPGKSGKLNQDYYGIIETKYSIGANGEAAAPILVGVVADGLSNSSGSDVAGQLAVETLRRILIENPTIPIKPRLDSAIRRANKDIFRSTQEHRGYEGTGTTVVAAAVVEDQLYLAHVGDSRAYLIRNRNIYLLTVDHRWGQEAVDSGEMTPAEAMEHPDRNMISRFVGTNQEIEVDHHMIDIERGALDPQKIQRWPLVDRMWLQPGDVILLCSDGLSDVVSAAQIENTMSRHSAQSAAQRLVDLANAAGGPDNITAVIFKLPRNRNAQPDWMPPVAVKTDPAIPVVKTSNNLTRVFALVLMIVGLASGVWLVIERWPVRVYDRQSSTQAIGTVLNPSVPVVEQNQPTNLTVLQPLTGVTLGGLQTFSWRYDVAPTATQAFEMVIWPVDQKVGQGITLGDVSALTMRTINLDNSQLQPGDYYWAVRLVEVIPQYRILDFVSEPMRFTYRAK